PDTDAVPNLTGFTDPDIQARREEIDRYHLEITKGKNAFPRQPFHKVVAISFLTARIERDGKYERYVFEELRSGGTPESNEEEMVKGFFQYCNKLRPRFVTYNGRGFDLPVLKYRAMKYKIDAEWLHQSGDKWSNYTQRYSKDWHCDLIDTLSDYGASAKCRLNEICSILGYPGKFGVDGGKVTDMFDKGDIVGIRDYCETDALNTYLVYLSYARHTGVINADGYEYSIEEMKNFLKKQGKTQTVFTDFLAAWDEAEKNA
ncbi:MAG: 3'-5' exonuclease, partial [Alphaproteobacteria bacterium]